MPSTLYERLGSHQGIAAIVNDVVDLHLVNPLIQTRFSKSDPAKLKQLATQFFCMGSGGSEKYTGRDMLEAHRGMNISEQEFLAVLDDSLAALQKNGVGQQEQSEVLAILYSLKSQVVRV